MTVSVHEPGQVDLLLGKADILAISIHDHHRNLAGFLLRFIAAHKNVDVLNLERLIKIHILVVTLHLGGWYGHFTGAHWLLGASLDE